MNFSTQEPVLTSIKREKFRVEIRKSLQAKEFEDKRSRLIAKSPIENKENTFYYILNEVSLLKIISFKFFQDFKSFPIVWSDRWG